MATGSAVRITGLKELNRAFKRIDKGLAKTELVEPLKKAADPVAKDAEMFALTRIRNMPRSPDWAVMRIGVSQAQGLVYMVPQQRGGRGSPRGGLKPRLLEQMESARDKNEEKVTKEMDNFLGKLAGENGF